MSFVARQKDCSHHGMLVRDAVVELTPEQAEAWLTTPPPPPAMWTKKAANDEKAQRLARLMESGVWDNDWGVDPETGIPVEPVMVAIDHGCVLHGHHRLTAITMIGHPVALRVLFWSKPKGWDRLEREEQRARQRPTVVCDACGWWSQFPEMVEAHRARAHGDAV